MAVKRKRQRSSRRKVGGKSSRASSSSGRRSSSGRSQASKSFSRADVSKVLGILGKVNPSAFKKLTERETTAKESEIMREMRDTIISGFKKLGMPPEYLAAVGGGGGGQRGGMDPGSWDSDSGSGSWIGELIGMTEAAADQNGDDQGGTHWIIALPAFTVACCICLCAAVIPSNQP